MLTGKPLFIPLILLIFTAILPLLEFLQVFLALTDASDHVPHPECRR
jgi:hypothetical protein